MFMFFFCRFPAVNTFARDLDELTTEKEMSVNGLSLSLSTTKR